MKDRQKIRDDARIVLKKFRSVDRPDRELFDQLRCLPDDVVAELQEEFGRNKTVQDVAAEREME